MEFKIQLYTLKVELNLKLIYNVTMIDVEKRLREYSSGDESKYSIYHKVNEGGYAAHYNFLCVTVPNIRKVAKEIYKKINLQDIDNLLESNYHEVKLCALIILVLKMQKEYKEEQDEIVKYYLKNAEKVDGWDLVDLSAPYIIGKYVLENPNKRDILYELANSDNMWKQRISIVANLTLIKNCEFTHILKIAKQHLHTEHDLIRKAIGWMLREVGKKDYKTEYEFLVKNYKTMPRTMLRYSIERFDEDVRQKFLKGEI